MNACCEPTVLEWVMLGLVLLFVGPTIFVVIDEVFKDIEVMWRCRR